MSFRTERERRGRPSYKKMSLKYILASKSPRRRELLGSLIEKFEIITADVDETVPDGTHPREAVELLAVRKGAAVAEGREDCVVISSDTLVELDGVALGKPGDGAEAYSMIRALSGRAHNVHTGVAVHYKGRVFSGVDSSSVIFRELSDSEISDYVATGEPMDKAGAYGIQGGAGRFVLSVDGRTDTVIGLSLALTEELITRALSED